ncbi:hypothetical protein, partial [Bacteroides faecis]|uniref:hypothetical protein n=1 Tax=Bacteroides faecis TaxID=674529 RepID=UPI0039C0C4E4
MEIPVGGNGGGEFSFPEGADIQNYEVVSKRWHNLFLCTKPRLSQARALLLPKVFVSLGIKFFVMAKLHFRPYLPN